MVRNYPLQRRRKDLKENDKIDFQNFVEKVLSKTINTSSVGSAPQQRTSLGGGRGDIVRTPKVDPGKIVPQQAGEETKENLDI